MAIIKQQEEKKVKMVKKEVTLTQELWSELTEYIKYAEIKGQAVAKRNFAVGEILKAIFKQDTEFATWKSKQVTKDAAKAKLETIIAAKVEHQKK